MVHPWRHRGSQSVGPLKKKKVKITIYNLYVYIYTKEDNQLYRVLIDEECL